MKRRRIAIVVQRYGEEVTGGAELLARWLAEHLHNSIAEVEVLTSCAVDFTTWRNEYPAGTSELNGIVVHRFAVDKPRDWRQSQYETWRLLNEPHTLADEQRWIVEQGPFSAGLLAYIEQNRHRFDWFIFSTYLYATTYFGLQLVADKAILIPNAHEEPYLYLPVYRPLFQLPRALVYNTETERQMVQGVMENQRQTVSLVAGIGINLPDQPPSAVRFQEKFGIEGPFLLYVGRITAAKNVPELVDYFIRYKQEQGGELKLVLAGKATELMAAHPDVVSLGFVSEQEKFDAIAAAQTVMMPSLYESLSMIALEAWLLKRPMMVNGRCLVLKNQCRLSHAGLYYHNFEEFAAVLGRLEADAELRKQLGCNGRKFVQRHYDWSIIIAKYQALFETLGS